MCEDCVAFQIGGYCPAFGNIFLRFVPKEIQAAGFRIGLDLPVPSGLEIDIGELFEELAFFLLLNRFTAWMISETSLICPSS
jgi:hypothetical protein